MTSWLERTFALSERGTNVRREAVAGATTFATMAYILFVQPVVLGAAGMDPGAVLVATALASAVATVLMAFLANYPIALAPGMGLNFYFAYTLCGKDVGLTWQTALGAVAVSGLAFVALAAFGVREALIEAIPMSLKRGIAVGIGLLIALVGLQYGGLVVDHPGTLVTLGSLSAPPALLSIFGLVVTIGLLVRGVPGALLAGILATTVVTVATGFAQIDGVVSAPPSIAPTLLAFQPARVLSLELLPVLFVLLFVDLFDTVGTLVGVSERAGLLEASGRLPRARGALLADALGTVIGAALGTTTVTSYIESASGVSAGGRTGLANLFTAALFVLAIFVTPLVHLVSGSILVDGRAFYPTIAPALVVVGFMMMQGAARIPWDDLEEAIPAFLAIIVMPLAFSITEGIAFGFLSYSLIKVLAGRPRAAHPLVHGFALLFLLRYAFLRA